MKASDHTLSMIRWWRENGVDRADLAVKRRDTMIWHRNLSLDDLSKKSRLQSWARAQNTRHAEVYVRPSRHYSWPLVLLDDVPMSTASKVIRKYDALVVKTSEEGGCHLWLSCSRALDEEARGHAQRWLALRSGADLASTSGEHLGRLAGFKNWKRGGTWVNVIDAALRGRPWEPRFDEDTCLERRPNQPSRQTRGGVDTSESGREWGWVCGMLEAGYDPGAVYLRLVERARTRRGRDTERYARRTTRRALDRVQQVSLP